MKQLLTSRRIWTLVIAGIVNIATLMVSHYFTDPFAHQMAVTILGLFDALAGTLILSLTVDDVKKNGETIKADSAIQVAAINAGTHPDYPPCPPITLDDISSKPMTAAEQHQADSIRQAYGGKLP